VTQDEERQVFLASPTDPNVEYAVAGERRGCHCPALGVIIDLGFPGYVPGAGFANWRTKILHVRGCAARMTSTPTQRVTEAATFSALSAHLAKLPPPVPCPAIVNGAPCGNVAYSMIDGNRRCDGPKGCGHVWNPRDRAPASGQPDRERTTRRSERAELIPVEV
jgi:hypothetical protein